MFIRFWGTRGSIPSPASGAQSKEEILNWLQSSQNKGLELTDVVKQLKSEQGFFPGYFGGETTSIEVGLSNSSSVFVDAGTGLRQVSTKYPDRDTYHILLTHVHWDHILGLPFFEPIFQKGKKINFYYLHNNAEEYIKVLFNGVNFPVHWDELGAEIEFHKIESYKETEIEGVTLTPFCLDHPGDSYGFRFSNQNKNIAICTDSSFERHTREQLAQDLKYYQGLDLIVFDAQYDQEDYSLKKSYGHCTPELGLKLAVREEIKKLVLTHHDPTYKHEKIYQMMESAQQEVAKIKDSFAPKVESAYDGMYLEV